MMEMDLVTSLMVLVLVLGATFGLSDGIGYGFYGRFRKVLEYSNNIVICNMIAMIVISSSS